jgi:hypothetical protein
MNPDPQLWQILIRNPGHAHCGVSWELTKNLPWGADVFVDFNFSAFLWLSVNAKSIKQ